MFGLLASYSIFLADHRATIAFFLFAATGPPKSKTQRVVSITELSKLLVLL